MAAVLEYKDTNKAITQHCKNIVKMSELDLAKSVKGVSPLSNENSDLTPYQRLIELGRTHAEIVVKRQWIPEFDVYRLIFGSKMDKAEQFQDWVCETVLPTLRKDGTKHSHPPTF